MADSKAIKLVNYCEAPAPTAERTLFVEGAPAPWPPYLVAQYCLRLAMENGCSKIVIRQGSYTKARFDVLDIMKHKAARQGFWNKPRFGGRILKDIATKGFKHLGSEFGITRPQIMVPVTLRSDTPVSGSPRQEGD